MESVGGDRTNIFLNMWFWPWYGHGSWSVGGPRGSGSRGPGPANLSGGGGRGWGENYWCIWSTRIAVFMFAKWRHRSRRRRLRRARMAPSLWPEAIVRGSHRGHSQIQVPGPRGLYHGFVGSSWTRKRPTVRWKRTSLDPKGSPYSSSRVCKMFR